MTDQRQKSLFNFRQFFVLLLLEFFVDSSHVFRNSLFLQLLETSEGLEVLLFGHFSCEDVGHYILLIFLHCVEGLAELENSDCAVLISYCCVLSSRDLIAASHVTDLDARQRGVCDLVGEGDFVLTVVVIPDIKPSVLSGEEEGSYSGGREAPIAEIAAVISSLDERSSQIIHPNFGRPVADRHKHFRELKISGDGVNRSKMSVL